MKLSQLGFKGVHVCTACCARLQELGVVVHVKMRRGCGLDGSEYKEQKKT